MSNGRDLAVEQLERIAAAHPSAILIEHLRPGWVAIGVDCRGFPRAPGGVALRAREWIDLHIPDEFPWRRPAARARHRRWADASHVQWDRSLCLYAAPAVEWDASDGMFGYVDRLISWLRAAAADELDPVGAPLHPPVAYAASGTPLVIVEVDTPRFTTPYWIGWAELDVRSTRRTDIVRWVELGDGATLPAATVAPTVLLAETFPFEFPDTLSNLFEILDGTAFGAQQLQALLGLAAMGYPSDLPLNVVLGTAQRGVRGGERHQHLTVWQMPTEFAETLGLTRHRDDDSAALAEARENLATAVANVAKHTKVRWCTVRDARPEVTRDRAEGSPMQWFAGRRVAIWGCGALGSHIADSVVRAGAAAVVLRDNGIVAPGILGRQLFDESDLGDAKVDALALRLLRINPKLEVSRHTDDVALSSDLDADWTDGCDLVFDATADNRVPKRTTQRRTGHAGSGVPVVTLVVGHTADHGLMTFTPATSASGPSTTELLATIALTQDPAMAEFANEFWPRIPRHDLFAPEPGCSEPTFTGAAAEVSALTGTMILAAARELAGEAAAPSATVLRLPHGSSAGGRSARVGLCEPALVLGDPFLGYEVHVAPEAHAQMLGWIRRAGRHAPGAETGGVLLGSCDPATQRVVVTAMTGPPPDSVASPVGFVCGTEGVGAIAEAHRHRTRGAVRVLGMWHTHPDGPPRPSPTDRRGMQALLDHEGAGPTQLLLIAGHDLDQPTVGAFMYDRDHVKEATAATLVTPRRATPEDRSVRIGLALSGGGSRAIAFHLGAMRALHDLRVLDRVDVLSSVSGGSVIGAMWAYTDEPFEEFDARVVALLRRGLVRDIVRTTLGSRHTPSIAAAAAAASLGTIATSAWNLTNVARSTTRRAEPPLRRWANRTTAFERVLRARLFGHTTVDAPARDLITVINAAELRGGNAFRFGSEAISSSRFGRTQSDRATVARAVAASAAFPILLPAIDDTYVFGDGSKERVLLTDGGVYDNLGISVMDPDRSPSYTGNVHPVDFVISCDAGQGVLETDRWPMWWPGRTKRSFETIYRKAQDAGRHALHRWREQARIEGFAMPYLGMRDESLPYRPPDLVTREAVRGYPTDFWAMDESDLHLLTTRGEQLTRIVIDWHCPQLLR